MLSSCLKGREEESCFVVLTRPKLAPQNKTPQTLAQSVSRSGAEQPTRWACPYQSPLYSPCTAERTSPDDLAGHFQYISSPLSLSLTTISLSPSDYYPFVCVYPSPTPKLTPQETVTTRLVLLTISQSRVKDISNFRGFIVDLHIRNVLYDTCPLITSHS